MMLQEPSPFSDRMNRLPYFLSSLVVGGGSSLLTQMLGGNVLSLVVVIATLFVGIILGVRRLHDLDLSGWAILMILIPLANIVFLLYLTFAKGTTGPNRFGADPLNG